MTNSMYGKDLARYYDLVYADKDYRKGANLVKDLILKNKKSKGKLLLEVACGTGRYLEYIEKDFTCVGLDLNEDMLKIARKRLSKTKLIRGNMVNFNLNQKFDVITCLFSSIGYLKTYDNLEKALSNFSKHLNKGGVVVIQPWLTKATYKVGTPHITVYQGDNIKIARADVSEAKGIVSIMKMHHLIAEKGKKVKYIVSTEELGMFETSKFLKLMNGAGFKSRFINNKSWNVRGVFVGIKS